MAIPAGVGRNEAICSRYTHARRGHSSLERIERLIQKARPELIIHCAVQPSHDLGGRVPMFDSRRRCDTLDVLEADGQTCTYACLHPHEHR